MSRLYLIRHPETAQVASVPSEAWSLSAEGRRQLDSLCAAPWWADVRHVYTSTNEKTIAVAREAANRHGTPSSAHTELRELARPWLAEGEYERAVARALARPDTAEDGWEAVAAAHRRVSGFIRSTVARGPLPAAVVSHGIVLSAFRAELLGKPRVDPAEWRALPFASVALMDVASWRLERDFAAPY